MNRKIIIAVIAVSVSVILGIVLFSYPDLITITTSNSEPLVLTAKQNFAKNAIISLLGGWAIYIILYAIPRDCKKVNFQKEK